MRALLVPIAGDVEVIDRPLWSQADVAHALGCEEDFLTVHWRHVGPTGRHYLAYHPNSENGPYHGISLVARRPTLMFAVTPDGVVQGLGRRDLFYLGTLIVLEEALLALPAGDTRKELT